MQKEQSVQDIPNITDTPSTKSKLYVAMVLDQSGSMQRGAKETIDGFNEQMQSVKQGATDEVDVEVVFTTFDSTARINKLFVNLSEMGDLTDTDYRPNGLTAMYDGVGITMEALRARPDIDDPNTKVLLVILSDGYENASKQFSQERVAELIQDVKTTERWTITYMGANQDLSEITDKLNIDKGNTVIFDASSAEGYQKGASMRSMATAAYMSNVVGGSVASASTEFYSTIDGDS